MIKCALNRRGFGVLDEDIAVLGDLDTILLIKDSGVASCCIITQCKEGFIYRGSVTSQL